MNPLNPTLNFFIEHAALGWGFVLAFHFLLPPSWFWPAFGILELVLLGKESLFDPRTEAQQPFLWAGVRDLGEYSVGFLLAAAAILLLIR